MPIVDMHAHIYPEKIADKATQSVGQFYNIPMQGEVGNIATLRQLRDTSPITHNVVCSVAVKPQTVTSINDFIASTVTEDSTLIGLAAMHQDFTDIESELDRITALGLRGVKLHPDSQAVNMDDPRLMRLYESCERRGLAVLIHCGDYRYDYSHPHRLKRILHEFPQLRVCAAHFGGWSLFDLALEFLEHEHCYLDVSSSMFALGLRRTRELIEDYTPSRILFGSDFPMWNPESEYSRFSSLAFSDASKELMTWRNAESWLACDIN